jgi:hypothetical protein
LLLVNTGEAFEKNPRGNAISMSFFSHFASENPMNTASYLREILAFTAGFGLKVDLTAAVGSLSQADAEKLIQTAHRVCPYSNATRNNVDVSLTVKTVHRRFNALFQPVLVGKAHGYCVISPKPSLRAQRSNLYANRCEPKDCFAALAMTIM